MDAGYAFSGEDHQDLVIIILLRLYVKSLIRCTCVCKSWHTLIKSSYFITKHLHRSRKTLLSNDTEEAPLFLTVCNKGLKEWMVSYITSTFNNNETEEVAALPDSLPFVENFFIPNTMGPVNGIYCWTKKPVSVEYDSLFLCNPALREVQSIPKIPRRSFVEVGEGFHYYLYRQTYGFGYDYNTSDYKVVAVTGDSTSAGLQIFVYTLSSNSWRRIPMKIDDFPALPFEGPPGLTDGDGVCHWLASDKHQNQMILLSFDFGSEAFKWSPLPLPQGHGGPNSNEGLCLSVLNEYSIMLIVLHDQWSRMEHKIKIGCCYEVFRMNEGGSTGEELWTMLYTIEPIPGVCRPLGFRKNGEIILAKFDGSLVTYDPSCEQINLLHIGREGFEGYQVCTYMESLVSICRGLGGA